MEKRCDNTCRKEDRLTEGKEMYDSGNGEEYCGQDVVRGYSPEGGWEVYWKQYEVIAGGITRWLAELRAGGQ